MRTVIEKPKEGTVRYAMERTPDFGTTGALETVMVKAYREVKEEHPTDFVIFQFDGYHEICGDECALYKRLFDIDDNRGRFLKRHTTPKGGMWVKPIVGKAVAKLKQKMLQLGYTIITVTP